MSERDTTKQEIEAVAALIGTTNAELKAFDKQIETESTSLQSSQKTWNPQQLLSNHINTVAGSPPPDQALPASPPEPSTQLLQVTQQMQTPPSPNPPPPPPSQNLVQNPVPPTMAGAELQIILQEIVKIGNRLDVIEQKVTSLESLDTKLNASVEKGLKSKVKQITIKLDDTTNPK